MSGHRPEAFSEAPESPTAGEKQDPAHERASATGSSDAADATNEVQDSENSCSEAQTSIGGYCTDKALPMPKPACLTSRADAEGSAVADAKDAVPSCGDDSDESHAASKGFSAEASSAGEFEAHSSLNAGSDEGHASQKMDVVAEAAADAAKGNEDDEPLAVTSLPAKEPIKGPQSFEGSNGTQEFSFQFPIWVRENQKLEEPAFWYPTSFKHMTDPPPVEEMIVEPPGEGQEEGKTSTKPCDIGVLKVRAPNGQLLYSPVIDVDTDAEGWSYGTTFHRLGHEREGGRARQRITDKVRRRIWRMGESGPLPTEGLQNRSFLHSLIPKVPVGSQLSNTFGVGTPIELVTRMRRVTITTLGDQLISLGSLVRRSGDVT